MKNFSTWMILSLDVIFWLLRVVAAYTSSMGMSFMAVPMDFNTEIILLFVALVSFILIAKRMFLGSILYLVGYGWYFGGYLWNNLLATKGVITGDYMSVFFSFIGIVLPLITLFDLLLDKNRKAHPTDKKTDWFYKNKQFDRNDDERADKNNYRTM